MTILLQQQYRLVVTLALCIIASSTACDVVRISFGNPTVTRTRTPRPTFTPRIEFTATPENTSTQASSPTREPTATLTRPPVDVRSPTPRPPIVVRSPTPRPPPPPPVPQFRFRQSSSPNQGRCDGGPGVYEVKGRVQNASGGYIGGISVVVLDKNGAVAGQSQTTPPEFLNPEFGVNCFESKNFFSYKIDFSASRANGPWILRLTISTSNLAPLSPNITIPNEPGGGRWYIDFLE